MNISLSEQLGGNTWCLTISYGEIAALSLGDEERGLLQECMEPGTPASRVLFGLTLLAGKIEGRDARFVSYNSRVDAHREDDGSDGYV